MSATTVDRMAAWRPILELDRGLKQEVTDEVFRRVRRLRARGERTPIMAYDRARMVLRGVGYRRGEPIASLVVYALAVVWLERMPARERIISEGYLLDGLASGAVRGMLREEGFRVGSRLFWYLLYGPDRTRNASAPAVVDWWTAFAVAHPSAAPDLSGQISPLTVCTIGG